jgi:tetratricopeptide (TPR) repeat protein
MIEELLKSAEDRMSKAVDVLKGEFESITGTQLHLLDGYFNPKTASTPELQLLSVDYFLWAGERDKALDICRRAMDSAEPGSVTLARIFIRMGRIYTMEMDLATAEEYLKAAVELSRKKMYIREEAAARMELASLLLKKLDAPGAAEQLRVALDLSLMTRDEYLISEVMAQKGDLKLAEEDVEGAVSDYTSSLIVTGDAPTPDKTYRLTICHQRAKMFEALGDFGRLSSVYMDCAEIYQSIGSSERAEYYAEWP